MLTGLLSSRAGLDRQEEPGASSSAHLPVKLRSASKDAAMLCDDTL